MMEMVGQCSSIGCRGKKAKLYYNPHKDVWLCFRCRDSGKGIPEGVELDDLPFDPGPSVQVTGVSEPPPYQSPDVTALDYLVKDRGIPRYLVDSLPIYTTGKGILFFFPETDCGYWQERRWKVCSPPKWNNPKASPIKVRSGLTYELMSRPESKTVVLVEGVVDALAVAPYGNVAAYLGIVPNDYQLVTLSQHYGRLVWMPDGDWEHKVKDRDEEFIRVLRHCTAVLEMPCETDPADMALHNRPLFKRWMESAYLEDVA